MRAGLQLWLSDPRVAAVTRRAGPFLLVLAAHILIIFVLLTLAPPVKKAFGDLSRLTMIQLNAPRPEPTVRKKQAVTKERKTVAPPRPVPAAPVLAPEVPEELRNLLRIDLAKSDIGRMRQAPAAAQADTGASAGEESASFTGPGGEPLYEADWYRRPTQAELAFYLPQGRRDGFGLIACKTAPKYRVEDCVALAESPGSGLSQAVLQAAWQFKVQPPRIGGRQMIGAWVRIRIDYTQLPAK